MQPTELAHNKSCVALAKKLDNGVCVGSLYEIAVNSLT